MTAVLLLAAFLRFYRLDNQSFWNDEGNSARLSERSIALIIEGTASDIHPPLYYLLLKMWRSGASSSEFGLRSLSVYLGIGLVAVTYSMGRKLLPQETSWLSIGAAFLVAVNPALIYYSQETRMYELMAFLAITSCLLLVSLLESGRHRLAIAAGYAFCMAAGFYTHYFFPTVLIVQLSLVAIWLWRRPEALGKTRKVLLAVGAALLLAILLYSPWLPTFLRQAGGRATDRDRISQFFIDNLRWLGIGDFLSGEEVSLGLIILLILIFTGLAYLITRGYWKEPYGLAIIVGAAAPLMMMVIIGTTQPVFYKFTLMTIPWLALLASLGLVSIGRLPKSPSGNRIILILILLLIGSVIWTSGSSLWSMYNDPAFARADYRGIADRIRGEKRGDAAVVLNAANQWEVFTYYYTEAAGGAATVLPIPRGNQKPELVYEELEEIAADSQRIYALFWGEAERDPERLVETWLDENTFKAQDEWVGDVRFVTYAVVPGSAVDRTEELNLNFGDLVQLQSASIGSTELFPGEILPITLRWLTENNLEQRYKVFLHLLDHDGQIKAQRDSEPGGGLAITNTWNPGELIEDNHGLLIPNGLLPGSYQLLIGLYDIADPADRLVIQTSEGSIDAYPLASITIKEP